jgi:hypothetical protein
MHKIITICNWCLGKAQQFIFTKFVQKIGLYLNHQWELHPEAIDADPGTDAKQNSETVQKKRPGLHGLPHGCSPALHACIVQLESTYVVRVDFISVCFGRNLLDTIFRQIAILK